MSMQPSPPYLKPQDTVAIVATAKKLEPGQIDGAVQLIQSWGLNVVFGPNLYAADRQFAGTDAQRAADLQWALNHPEVKAILFARGGYGTARIIDQIDWTAFLQNPKWLCGFSDLTVLHSHIHQTFGLQTLHSSMPIFFADGITNVGSDSLRDTLFGQSFGMQWSPHPLNVNGEVTAPLVGGNLSVLHSIAGTRSEINLWGKILFLEDLTENLYHLDRMMVRMKRSGQLERIVGLIVGQFTEMIDNPVSFGKSAYEIILEATCACGYPIAFDAPIGHVSANRTVVHGGVHTLQVDDGSSTLELLIS